MGTVVANAGRIGRIAVVVLAVAVSAAVVPVPGAEGAEPVRYLDRVFDQVEVTRDVVFQPAGVNGRPDALALDVYEPAGDPATARPLVVWMHGYGPASSDKASPLDVEIVTRFAKHGAVVASFNYWVHDGQAMEDAILDPLAAVAWLRTQADRFHLDLDRVAFAGISAGAYRTMHAAYDLDITADQPPPESRVDAVLSFSGTGPTDTFQPGEPPLFMAHGELDVNAMYANAVATCEGANAAGVPCEFHSYPDADHYGLFAHADELEELASAWLYDVLDLANAQNPPLPTTTTTTSTTTTTTTTPSPPIAPPADPVPTPADFAG